MKKFFLTVSLMLAIASLALAVLIAWGRNTLQDIVWQFPAATMFVIIGGLCVWTTIMTAYMLPSVLRQERHSMSESDAAEYGMPYVMAGMSTFYPMLAFAFVRPNDSTGDPLFWIAIVAMFACFWLITTIGHAMSVYLEKPEEKTAPVTAT